MVHMDFSLTLEIGIIYDSALKYDLTDTLTNNLPILSDLPNLPNKNINFINDDTLDKKEFEDLYSIFENNNDIILHDDDKTVKKEKRNTIKKI